MPGRNGRLIIKGDYATPTTKHHLAGCFVQQFRRFMQDGGIVDEDARIITV